MNIKNTTQFPPGATIGMLGSGQLGKMFGLAARSLGYNFHVYSPDANSPTEQIGDRAFVGQYNDLAKIAAFAKSVDIITLEFENIPLQTLTECAKHAPVAPNPQILEIAQNRLKEKNALKKLNLPVTPFQEIKDNPETEIKKQLAEWNTPGILKTAESGYDGKGQAKINSPEEGQAAWEQIGSPKSAILEQLIPFDAEASVIGARNLKGEFAAYGPFENQHKNHILHLSSFPPSFPKELQQTAIEITKTVMGTIRRHRLTLHRIFHPRQSTPHQRNRTSPSQLGTPHSRRKRVQPVRATCPRRLRLAARLHSTHSPRCNGQPAWRPLGIRLQSQNTKLEHEHSKPKTPTSTFTENRPPAPAEKWDTSPHSQIPRTKQLKK